MKKLLIIMLVAVISISMLVTFSLTGCKGAVEEAVTEAVEEAVEEVEEAVEEAVEEVEEAAEVVEEAVEEEAGGDEIDPWILEIREGLEGLRYEIPSESQGPDGQTPTWDTELVLTVAEVEKIREGREDGTPFKLATNLDGDHGSWTVACEKAIKDACDYLNIEIVALGNAEYDPTKQMSDIETLMALDPDIIISAPVDRITAAEAFRPAVDAGVSLVFWSNTPEGYVHGEDYVGISAADIYGEGLVSGKALGEIVGGSGQVGFAVFGADFWICNYVDQLARDTLEENYPDVEVVAYEGWSTIPEAEGVAAAMIQRYPDIKGFYVSWYDPAQNVAAACQDAGRDDIKISTLGVDTPSLINMLSGGNIAAILSDMPYYMGLDHVIVGAYGLLDKPCPEFTICPVTSINKDNVEEIWGLAFKTELPDEVAELIE
jgi:ribose transport system substrate-binding protein